MGKYKKEIIIGSLMFVLFIFGYALGCTSNSKFYNHEIHNHHHDFLCDNNRNQNRREEKNRKHNCCPCEDRYQRNDFDKDCPKNFSPSIQNEEKNQPYSNHKENNNQLIQENNQPDLNQNQNNNQAIDEKNSEKFEIDNQRLHIEKKK